MGEVPRSPTPNFYSILGISKTATLSDISKAYKSLVTKWNYDKNQSNKVEAEAEFRIKSLNDAYRALSGKKRGDDTWADVPKTPNNNNNNKNNASSSPNNNNKNNASQDDDGFIISNPVLLSRIGSRGDYYSGSFSRCSSGILTPGSAPTTPNRRSNSTPIIYSQTTARRKPPPVEQRLECTLEDLLHGCLKNVTITRDVVSDVGLILQEEETLRIRVKSGWRKGTKITFEGKGDERPGSMPADLVFVIDEKRHPLFKRHGDDLELGVEIPLLQALSGCTIDVPLLEGKTMPLSIDDDIIYPGYETIIPGQGMPKFLREEEGRGDLHLKFMVDFPTEMSHEQRSKIVSILNDCS
ncbi:hypothetical protein LguiB_021850 [Lonicera macranthoides]